MVLDHIGPSRLGFGRELCLGSVEGIESREQPSSSDLFEGVQSVVVSRIGGLKRRNLSNDDHRDGRLAYHLLGHDPDEQAVGQRATVPSDNSNRSKHDA